VNEAWLKQGMVMKPPSHDSFIDLLRAVDRSRLWLLFPANTRAYEGAMCL